MSVGNFCLQEESKTVKNVIMLVICSWFVFAGETAANVGQVLVTTNENVWEENGFSGLSFSEEQKKWIAGHAVVKIGVLKSAPPYEYITQNGIFRGIASSYTDIISANTGIVFETVEAETWDEMYRLLEQGDVDVLPFAVRDNLFGGDMIFSAAYISSSLGIFSNGRTVSVNDLKDIEDEKTAVVRNMIAYLSLGKSTRYNWVSYDSILDAVKDVNRGVYNFYVGDIFNTKFIIEKFRLKKISFAAPVTGTTYSFGFGTVRENAPFIEIVNQILEKITPAHRAEIKQRWINSEYENAAEKFPYRQGLLWLLGILLAVIAVVLYRYWKLREKNFRLKEKAAMAQQFHQMQKLESIGRLAGGVAHDFNNMLAGINGAAECLETQLGKEHALNKYADIILNACARASHLTSQLLLFARDKKKEFEVTDMHECVQESLYLLEHGIGKKIVIQQDFQAKNHYVLGNRDLLQSMILNLGFNAKDAMPDGGVLTVETKNKSLHKKDISRLLLRIPEGEYFELVVKDTGIGIDKDIIHKIFEPFFTTKEVGKGTGLGLSAVYGIVGEHKGSIIVRNRSKGTAFHIYFPITENKVQKTVQRKKAGKLKAKVLVTDDEKILLELLGDILKAAGSEVIAVNDSLKAAEVYQNTPGIDLVMLDVIMPGKSGVDVYNELKKINPDVKVVFMSGYTRDAQINELVEKNENIEFINKPYAAADVVEKLAMLLAKK